METEIKNEQNKALYLDAGLTDLEEKKKEDWIRGASDFSELLRKFLVCLLGRKL